MTQKSSTARSKTGLVLALLVAFTKSTKIIAALKVVKFTKPLLTLATMLVSAFFYGLLLGPWFGVGLVAMLFIHEMGHVIALRMKGYDTPGPVFIPFLGAVIFSPKFNDRESEAFVAYGGPLLGTLGALLCLVGWAFTEGKTAEILLIVSFLGIFLNLFNLIPLSPLDGGRITQAVGAWFKWVGLAILLGYTLLAQNPGLLLIWILVLDGFERLPLWIRPILSSGLAIAMVSLMLLGHGIAVPWYIIVIDTMMAIVFTILYVVKEKIRIREGNVPEEDNRRARRVGKRLPKFGYSFQKCISPDGEY